MLPWLRSLLLPAIALALLELMTVCKLVTYAGVLHCCTLNMLKTIIMPINLQIIG